MANSWQERRWGDLATLEYGKSLRGYENSAGQYPVYGTNGPIGLHSEPLCNHPGVVIGRKGAYRGVHYAPKPFYVIDTAFYLEPKVDLDLKWAYYALLKQDINSMDSGSAIPSTSRADFYALPIAVPTLTEQRMIAQVLGTLDDKIELNRRMNETLEAMAWAIFKSWFVDFDPVHAKAEGCRPFGVDAATAALFPSSFQDSPLSKVPKGWDVGSVSEEFSLTMGQSPPGNTYNEVGEGTPFFQGRTDFGFRYPTERVYCTAPTRFANPGDTLVSVRAPVGDINMAAVKCAVGRGVAALRHKTGSRSFTYYAMKGLQDEFARFEAEGTVFGSISKEGFAGITCVIPPMCLVEKFEKLAFALDQAIENNEKESNSLAAIRDALLPKLISGEIRVKGAEKFVRR